jgi:3-oxoacyl-[acyl-carrier protein] reductase
MDQTSFMEITLMDEQSTQGSMPDNAGGLFTPKAQQQGEYFSNQPNNPNNSNDADLGNGPDDQALPQTRPACTADQPGQSVALITGGNAGLGLAAAIELAKLGWSIFLQHAPGASPAQAQQAILHAAGQANQDVQVVSKAADLGQTSQREQLVEGVLENLGRIDMLVNAVAGPTGQGEDLLELTEGHYAEVIENLLTANLFLTQRVASEMVRMVEAGLVENPKIVTINSINAYTSSVDSAPQCIGQAGLGMMTRLFADRLGEYGINVYEVRIGILATTSSDQGHARYDSLIADGLTPIRRWGRPGDVARAISAIAQDLLGFSTGQIINVDGGFHLRRL